MWFMINRLFCFVEKNWYFSSFYKPVVIRMLISRFIRKKQMEQWTFWRNKLKKWSPLRSGSSTVRNWFSLKSPRRCSIKIEIVQPSDADLAITRWRLEHWFTYGTGNFIYSLIQHCLGSVTSPYQSEAEIFHQFKNLESCKPFSTKTDWGLS
jgi:hypothetical protein